VCSCFGPIIVSIARSTDLLDLGHVVGKQQAVTEDTAGSFRMGSRRRAISRGNWGETIIKAREAEKPIAIDVC
jgi:hypothetical protein